MRIKYLVAISIISLFLINCSNTNKQADETSISEIYKKAQQKLQNGHWKQAIIQLEKLNSYYPIGFYAQKAQLDLIYAYYKNSDLSLARTTIYRFIRLNPTHPNIDWVFYMSGLTNMALDNSFLQSFWGIDYSDRDPQYARDALNDFSKLVNNYPNSRYINKATNYLKFLKNRLAKYEYSVAYYYANRCAWVAVINRVQGMLQHYPDTQATRNGLKLMENAYRQMYMNDQADKVIKIINAK